MSNLIRDTIRKCTAAWWETYGRIWPKNRKSGMITPNQNYLQRKYAAVIEKMQEEGYPVRVIGLKPRQRGSTTYLMGEGYARMRREPTSACVIAGEYSQTSAAWQMLQTYHHNDHFGDAPSGWNNHGEINEEVGKFSNGSKLRKETAGDKHAGIADTYQWLHVTELGRWATLGVVNASEVLSNILKCVPIDAGTMVAIESTAEGDVGEFPTRYRDSITAEEYLSGEKVPQPGDYISVFAAWFQFDDSAIRLTAEQKAHVEATLDSVERYKGELDLITDYGVKDASGRVIRLGEDVTKFDVWEQLAWRRMAIDKECKKDSKIFDRDYPHSADAAFQASGRPVFNKTGLKAMKLRAESKNVQPGVLEEQREPNKYVFRPTGIDDARFLFWERPMRGRHYSLIVDMMTGASQAAGLDPDCHSVGVLRKGYWEPGRRWVRPALVARIPGPCRVNIDILEEWIWRLSCYYGGESPCIIIPEENMDRGIIELLKKRLRGAKIYVREQWNKREQKMEPNSYGWRTTAQNRGAIVEVLAKAIREYDTDGEGLDLWSLDAIEELRNFVNKDNGRQEASTGKHDDDVLMLAIGLQTIDSATEYTEPVFIRPLPRDLQALEERTAAGTGSAQYS